MKKKYLKYFIVLVISITLSFLSSAVISNKLSDEKKLKSKGNVFAITATHNQMYDDLNTYRSFFSTDTSAIGTSTFNIPSSNVKLNGFKPSSFLINKNWYQLGFEDNGYFQNYGSDYLRFKQVGKYIIVTGSFSLTTSGNSANVGGSTTDYKITQLPPGYSPNYTMYFLQKASANTNYMLTVDTDGYLKMSRLVKEDGYYTLSAGEWISINIIFPLG